MNMSDEERKFHRKVAAYCFNRTWDLLDKKKRTNEDNLQMLHLTHTQRYRWGLIGTPENRAVGEWQVSRVYAELGQPNLALQFARSCLAMCKREKLSNIKHTANEAMARAYAVAKDYPNARRFVRLEANPGYVKYLVG